MVIKEKVYSSAVKFNGIYNFKDYYKFCYDWLTEQTNLNVYEEKYSEKLQGDEKELEIKWTCIRKLTDYFKFEMKIVFRVLKMKEIEVVQGATKIKTNQGSIKVKVGTSLIRDWQGKFERSTYRTFMREVYDKWVIPARIQQLEDKIIDDSDEFLNQAKAWLDLEGKK